MPTNNTHSFEKPAGGGPKRHYWTEEDEHTYTTFTVNDETDSVSLHVHGTTKGIWAPHFKVEADVRISPADTVMLRNYLTEILVEQGVEKPQPTGTLMPRFAQEIGPNEPVVTFCRFECRACGVLSDVVRDEGDSAEYAWLDDHRKTAHGGIGFEFYRWSVTRNTGRTGA